MKKMITMLMFVLCGTMSTACIEDGPLPADDDSPDAVPPDEPDACPTSPDAGTPEPDSAVPPDASCPTPAPTLTFTADPAVITVGESSTLSWTSTNVANLGCILTGEASEQNGAGTKSVSPTVTTTYELFCHGPCGSITESVTVTVNPAPECTCDNDCNDGFGWTSDSCAAGAGDDPDVCVHVLNDCGGMQIRPSESAVTCVFWGGYNIPEPAPALGNFPPESLATGPAGGLWKSAPASACSVICYSSGGNPVALDLQIEWSGVTDSLAHAEYTGLTKGTFDGLNMQQ